MRLFFDTETTGLEGTDLPIQIAYLLESEDGRPVAVHSSLVTFEGYTGRPSIDPDAARVHGIDAALLAQFGRPPEIVLMEFRAAVAMARVVVGHNVSFDIRMVNQALARLRTAKMSWPDVFCTMRESTTIVQMPGVGVGSRPYKSPKLGEAYHFFTGKAMRGAHDALADVYGARVVYKGIVRHREQNPPPAAPAPGADPTPLPAPATDATTEPGPGKTSGTALAELPP